MTPEQLKFIDLVALSILTADEPEDLFRATIRTYRDSVREGQPAMSAAEAEQHVSAFTSDLLDRIDEIEEHGTATGNA
jgi:hypothetical protein